MNKVKFSPSEADKEALYGIVNPLIERAIRTVGRGLNHEEYILAYNIGPMIFEISRWHNAEVKRILAEQINYGFYQLCPKCDGQKTVSRPPGTPSDVRPCSSWEASYPCDICKGEGVIPRPEIKNMQP